MKKLKLPCFSKEDDVKYDKEVEVIEHTDYDIEDEYKVADYDPDNVKNEYLDIFHTTSVGNANLMLSAVRKKTFKSTIFGVTWKPLLAFIVLYFLFQCLYQTGVFNTCPGHGHNQTHAESPEEAAICNRIWHDWVTKMKDNESTATRYLTFILGFYVGQMIKRWWDQVKSIPYIDSITNCMAGFVQLEFKDEESKAKTAALELKKKVVRYCLLSWTMCLASISPPLKDKFRIGENYIEKGLITEKELIALQSDKPSCWNKQWWIPITWAISLVNANHPDSQGCKVKDQKDFISQLNKFQSKLHTVSEYQNNPLPLIYGQALMFCIYSWIFLAIFSTQYLELMHSASVIFFAIPWFQMVKIILIYAWMKVANIVRNPFGLDEGYDINLLELLDHNIWKASLSIKHMDNPIYKH